MLHYYLDLSLPEVAEILDIPYGTVTSRLHRGLEAMRASMRVTPHAESHPGHRAIVVDEHLDFERAVAGHIRGEGVNAPSDSFYDELITRARRSGQRPEWLALLKESPMRTDSTLAVGSPTFRAAAILLATLLFAVSIAGAGIAGSRLIAADGTIVVDQSGSGDFTTVAEAVAAAQDGDTVLIKPGRYAESVAVIGKDLPNLGRWRSCRDHHRGRLHGSPGRLFTVRGGRLDRPPIRLGDPAGRHRDAVVRSDRDRTAGRHRHPHRRSRFGSGPRWHRCPCPRASIR